MNLRHITLVLGLTLIAACSMNPGEKFPYPPQFASPSDVPPTVLKAPPQPGSKEHARQIQMVINTQKHLTEQEKTAAFHESPVEPEMITFPVLGEDFTAMRYPATYQLLRYTGSDSWRISDTAKNYWNTKRPWLSDTRVKLYVEPIHSGSYPSGHTVTNHVWARVLGELIPSKRVEFIVRADEVANNRVKGGVHYYSDVHGGIRLADVIYCKMRKSPEYQSAIERARFELRKDRPYLTSATPAAIGKCAA